MLSYDQAGDQRIVERLDELAHEDESHSETVARLALA